MRHVLAIGALAAALAGSAEAAPDAGSRDVHGAHWQLSKAATFGELKREEAAVALPGHFCSEGHGLILLADRAPSGPQLEKENIVARRVDFGVEVWIAPAPNVRTGTQAAVRFAAFLSEAVSRGCPEGTPRMGVTGAEMIGLTYVFGEDGVATDYHFDPPKWRCGSFMNPNCTN